MESRLAELTEEIDGDRGWMNVGLVVRAK